ncbi:MAG: HDOD domain-containing protein [Pseudomonadota bacterium]
MKQRPIFEKLEAFKKLPSLPHILLELLDACQREDTSFKDLALIIEKDPALSAKVMELVNSAYYGLPYEVTSLAQTLPLLGFAAVKNISLSSSVYNVFKSIQENSVLNIGLFWWHSLLCANIAKLFARQKGYKSHEEAFLAGLLHDIGRLILCSNFSNDYASLLESGKQNEWPAEELKRFGATHSEVGAWVVQRWHLKSFMSDAILYHHESPERVSQALPLVQIVYVSNLLAQEAEAPTDKTIQIGRDILRLTTADIEEMVSEARKRAIQTAQSLGIDIASFSDTKFSLTAEQYKEKQLKLTEKVLDIARLHGTVQSLLGAKGDGILRTAEEGVHLLFDIDRTGFFTYDKSQNILTGRSFSGSQESGLIGQMRVPCKPKTSMLVDSLLNNSIIESSQYASASTITLLDEQLIRAMSSEAVIYVPMKISTELIGVMALAGPASRTRALWDNQQLLGVYSGHVALAIQADILNRKLDLMSRLKSSIVDYAPVMILSVDAKGNVLHMNHKARDVFWQVSEETNGFLRIFKSADTEARNAIAAILQGSEKNIPRFRHALPSGDHLWLSGSGLPLLEENGEQAFLILLEDITGQVVMEEQNKEYAIKLEEKVKVGEKALKDAHHRLVLAERLAAAGSLASRVAHEVNNPLAIIKNYLKVLELKVADKANISEELKITNEEIDRVAAIVQDLADFSHPDIQKLEPVDVNGVISDILKISREALLIQSRIEIDYREEAGHLTIVTDRNRIKQVFINFIKNASEAMPEGGKLIIKTGWAMEEQLNERLKKRAAEQKTRYAEIDIIDNGPGIPEHIQKRLFEPFVSSKGAGHSGLGLSISYNIIQELQGAIVFETTEGKKGATFRLFLPEKWPEFE